MYSEGRDTPTFFIFFLSKAGYNLAGPLFAMPKLKLPDSLVSVHWLAENLHAENLIILDASIKPVSPDQSDKQKAPVYIPGAVRFDIDQEMSDTSTSLPHMMPLPEIFTEKVQALGINHDSAIVAYDQVGLYSSPRAWCMFRGMEHDQVAVLDGGLPAWMEAGYKTVPTLSFPQGRGNFTAQPQRQWFVDASYVLRALTDPTFTVIDARSEGRFKGSEPEPRAGLRGGHMPGAVNIPFTSVLENGKLLSESELKSIFEKYTDKKMVFSCGSGVTACVVAFAAEQAGHENLSIYDGSWSEWGQPDAGLPVETG